MERIANLTQEAKIKIWNDQTKSITYRKVEELKRTLRATWVQKTWEEEDDLEKIGVDWRK